MDSNQKNVRSNLGTGTPCIRVCKLNPHTNICEGCFRTLVEISNWLSYSDWERAEIIKCLECRKKALT